MTAIEFLVNFLKYSFVVALGVEVALILRALYTLAREKAHAAEPPSTSTES